VIGRHALLCLCFLLIYVFLSSPAVIIISRLGLTVWYPAIGLIFALLTGVSPKYVLLPAIGDTFVRVLFYHEPIFSWYEILGSLGGTGCYATAAYVLRGPLRIDIGLRRRIDVVRYIFVTLLAAVPATLFGVAMLAAGHAILWSQFWSSAASWYVGDATGLLGFAPFLLVYLLPIVRRKLPKREPSPSEHFMPRERRTAQGPELLELVAQFFSIPGILWLVFAGPAAAKHLYYISYLPIIWIAMRQGIRRVVAALVFFNFGIVLTLRIFEVPSDVVLSVGLLMLVSSSVGLMIGSTVTERFRIGQELGERTMYLNSLIENTPLGIVAHDRFGRVELCNDGFESLFLFPRGELVGNELDLLIVPANGVVEGQKLTRVIASGERVHAQLQRKRKDGSILEVELHAAPVVLDGDVCGTIAIYADVTDRKLIEIRLREQAEALTVSVATLQMRTEQAGLLNEMGDLFQSCEASGEATSVVADCGERLFPSAGFGALYLFKSSRNTLDLESSWGKIEAEDLTFGPHSCWALRRGQPHWSRFPGNKVVCSHLKGKDSSLSLCVPMMARGEATGILHLRYDQFEIESTEPANKAWRDTQTQLAVSVAAHVALSLAALRLRESLRDQSVRDSLTGLFNRRFMQESLDRELQRAARKMRPLTVVFLDIDHFKRFNDVFGHAAGDSVLLALAELMRSFYRGDDVVCRYGGEEFAVILPEATEQEAAIRLNEFRQKVKDLVVVGRGAALDSISISVGIAAFPKHGSTSAVLLEAADKALYLSKFEGRDRVSIAADVVATL